jgi:hypothetical protein
LNKAAQTVHSGPVMRPEAACAASESLMVAWSAKGPSRVLPFVCFFSGTFLHPMGGDIKLRRGKWIQENRVFNNFGYSVCGFNTPPPGAVPYP